MSIKTFINGQENGVITFKGNTEPCAVYVNGERQDNISYLPQSVEGVNSVEYSSEYKRNIRTMQIDGNTEQYQGVFAPQNITIPTSYENLNTPPILVGSTPITVPSGAKLILTPTKTGSGDISTLSSGFIVIISSTKEGISTDYTTIVEDYGTPQITPTKVSAEFYIGIANFLAGGIDNPQAYWDFLLANYTFMLSTEGNTVPNPDLPQPIHNANNNGMSLVLSGENLFNAQGERSKTVGSFVYANNSIYRGSIGDGGYMYLIYAKIYKAGTYTISEKGEFNNVNNIALLTTANIPNSTYNSYYGAYRTNLVSSTITERSVTFTATQDFQIGFAFGGTTGGSDKIYDIMLSTTGGEYKPYTETTIAIPPSVTIDGTNVPLSMSLYDKIVVDRLNGKVKYVKGSYELVFDETRVNSPNLYISPQNNVNYFIYRVANSNFLKNNVGLCSHFLKGVWSPLTSNRTFAIIGASSYTNIAFRVTPTTTLSEFRQLLIDKANEGNPVTVIAQRVTPLEYDITSTDLGQALLNLPTENQTNIITITSTPSVSNLSVNYAKYGGTQ